LGECANCAASRASAGSTGSQAMATAVSRMIGHVEEFSMFSIIAFFVVGMVAILFGG
jgi:hypothetical protein